MMRSAILATVLSATGLLPVAAQEPAPSPPPEAVRVGGGVKPPQQTKKINAEYPQAAIAAGIEGIVILEATIGVDGKVRSVRVLRPVPFLNDAAVAAVQQWEYTPTLLAGRPTPVIMTVTMTFTLNGQAAARRPPLITTPWPAAQGALRAGFDVKAPRLKKEVRAVYPVGAQVERRSGASVLEVLIGPDGKVMDVRSLRPETEFDQSAIEAVKKREYEPTLVNGVARSVVLPVIVTFAIKQ
jgi:TonB family protein